MVVGLLVKYPRCIQPTWVVVVTHHDFEESRLLVFEWDPVLQGVFLAQSIDDANALSGLEVLRFISHLERIQLFEDSDGDGHPIVFETPDGIVVVKKDRGVENEHLDLDVNSALFALALFNGGLLFGIKVPSRRVVIGGRVQKRGLGCQVRIGCGACPKSTFGQRLRVHEASSHLRQYQAIAGSALKRTGGIGLLHVPPVREVISIPIG